jgi:predicted amidohydrolase
LHVTALQLDIAWEDPAANRSKVERLLAGREACPGTLIALPEMFATGFSLRSELAEEVGGRIERFLADVAKRHAAHVVGGVLVRGADGRVRNQAVACGPAGQTIARYAKMHAFSFAGEHEVVTPGDEVCVFDCGGVRVAPFVCYDLRFPEVFRDAVRRGAEAFVVIANWPGVRHDHWTALLRARAIENQACVVGVNRCGADPKHAYAGGSVVFGPRGETLAEAGDAEALVEAEFDADDLRDYRTSFPALRDMREDGTHTT